MANVLLIYPPYSWEMKHPPIGLAYMAAVLERAGHCVTICDMNPLGLRVEDVPGIVRECAPRLVGISAMTPQIEVAHRIAQAARSADAAVRVVVGGPHVSAIPAETLHDYPAFDFVASGEGEWLLLELVESILGGASSYEHIRGLSYREQGVVCTNLPREPVLDLDSLPMPAWHLLPMDKYAIDAYGGRIGQRTHVILTSRACPYHCIFCDSHSVFGRRFRSRSPESIVEEIEFLHRMYGITQFDLADDMITVNQAWLANLCQTLENRDIPKHIVWMANARVNTVNAGLLSMMKAAGCVRVDYGVESGDPRVLEAIKKGITIEQAIQAHRWSKEAGLMVGTFFMVGNPGEDYTSAHKTLALAQELSTDFPSVGIATPFPGTELYRIAREKCWLLVTDWSRYDTTPRLQGRRYRPVMRTEYLSQQDILNAYYLVHSQLVQRNLQARYGKWFFFNPAFYRDRRIFRYRRVDDIVYRISLLARAVLGRRR